MTSVGSRLPAEGYRLEDISPRAFQHPADRAATAALGSIPYLDKVVRKLIELGYERALRQSYLGSSVRLSEHQLGDVYREHAIAYATLDMPDVPDLYLTQYPSPNALAIGARRPIVVVQSELVHCSMPINAELCSRMRRLTSSPTISSTLRPCISSFC